MLRAPRPPVTLWRYVMGGLWRLIVLTTAVLVTVLAFAAAVKLLADGKLGPADTVRFMGYAIPPMLQYALPFAAGFGATLAYHRLAADNEVSACQAGGISYRTLLAPALLTGAGLAAVLVGLSNHAIPFLLREMQDMATQDATRIMVNSIRRGEAVDLGGRKYLAADIVEPRGPDPAVGAYEVLWLKGVLAVQLDRTGQVEWEGAAEAAWVWFFREDADSEGRADELSQRQIGAAGGGSTLVRIRFEQLVTHRAGQGRAEAEDPNWEQRVSSPLRDDPQFLSWRELREVRRRPEMMGPVNNLRRELATMLAERATTGRIAALLAREGTARLEEAGGGQSLTVRAGALRWNAERRWWQAIGAEGEGAPVRVERTLPNGRTQVHAARRVFIRSLPSAEARGREVSFEVRLEEVATTGASVEPGADRPAPAPGTRRDLVFGGLIVPGGPVEDFLALPCDVLLARADEWIGANPWEKEADHGVGPRREALRQRIDRLERDVLSKAHQRAAFAASCLVMVLTGCVMAMRLRDSLPLAVYLWSFGPALGAVMTILGGQQMVQQHGAVGLPILWGGVGGLSVFAIVEYVRLRRH